MSNLKVLHITPWYPNDNAPNEGIWIQNHIRLLEPEFQNTVIQVQIRRGRFKIRNESLKDGVRIVISLPGIFNWGTIEWFVAFRLRQLLAGMKAAEQFDLVNFHIAYPTCVHIDFYSKWLPKNRILIEHSSQYHFRFHSSKKLQRIKDIFDRPDLKYVAVSSTLVDNIREFSGSQREITILENTVDTKFFYYQPGEKQDHFLMAAIWSDPKRPLDVLRALVSARKEGRIFKIRLAGSGSQWAEIMDFIAANNLQHQVEVLGVLSREKMATEMKSCNALLMPTGYETFSVVTYEALCSGTPVIASPAGALVSAIHEGNGFLVSSEEEWIHAMTTVMRWTEAQRAKISADAQRQVNETAIKAKYLNLIQSALGNEISGQ